MGILIRNFIKFSFLLIFIFSFTTNISAEENNCTKNYSSSKLEWLQKKLCNNGSNKLNLDQNSKIGTFYFFKIFNLK